MNKEKLEKLSKSELINLILQQNKKTIKRKPIPAPSCTVKQMVQEYEDNIIRPPFKFRDKLPTIIEEKETPIPAKRTKTFDINHIPEQRTIIKETNKALKGFTTSYEISIKNNKDPLIQVQNTRKAIEIHIEKVLNKMKGLKLIETLKITFEKQTGREEKIKSAYFNSIAQTVINKTQIELALNLSKQQILNKVAQWISEGSGWVVLSIDNHYLNIVKYEPMKGNSYIKLSNELFNSSKGLINLKNIDNECFRWGHIRHLNPQNKDPQRIKKSDKAFIQNLDYQGIEFPVTIKQINKIEKQNSININVFCYENKQPFPICISKENNGHCMNLLLITEETKTHYVLIKDFNKFMFNQTKHKERKYFCMYCLQFFSSEQV